jgi:hypothetical protein
MDKHFCESSSQWYHEELYLNDVANLPASREQLIIRGSSVGVATLMIRQILVLSLLRQTSWF